MYTNRRTPRTTPRPTPSYTLPRATPGRARTVAARRRLNFGPTGVSPSRFVARPSPKSRIGFNPGVGTGSRAQVITDQWSAANSTKLSKSLHFDELTFIPRKTAAEVNARERDIINCLGFTLRLCFRSSSTLSCATVRMAVVSPIDRNDISVVEFFRGYQDKRSQDFASTLDTSELLHSPINRDKFVVLWEKKLELGPLTDVTTGMRTYSRSLANYKTITSYVPLNRQLRYTGSAAGDCADKVYLVYWYDEPNNEGSATGASFVRCQRWAAAHWKDP